MQNGFVTSIVPRSYMNNVQRVSSILKIEVSMQEAATIVLSRPGEAQVQTQRTEGVKFDPLGSREGSELTHSA